MANNELSGTTVVTFLAKWLQELRETDYSYRIIFIPETIGSITYLSRNYKDMKNKIFAGFNVSCVGDDRAYSFLPSRNGKTISDLIAKHTLKWTEPNFIEYSWFDRGSDERQYCAPGIDLPIASILRTKYGQYPEYHTSGDNLDFITPDSLLRSYKKYILCLDIFENNFFYKTSTLCEPMMKKYDLYPSLGKKDTAGSEMMMNLLAYCDGENDLIDIADKIGRPIWELLPFIKKLLNEKLINKQLEKYHGQR